MSSSHVPGARLGTIIELDPNLAVNVFTKESLRQALSGRKTNPSPLDELLAKERAAIDRLSLIEWAVFRSLEKKMSLSLIAFELGMSKHETLTIATQAVAKLRREGIHIVIPQQQLR